MNNKWQEIYCDFNGRIFGVLNNRWKESLFLAFIITLIFLSWILKMLEL